jgi:hypothetical protein
MENRRFIGKIGNQVAYLYRVDKRKARAFFALGSNVYLVPDQLDPFNQDLNPLPVNQGIGDFEKLSEQFKNYFCLNSNTGYFPAYYVDLFESNLKFPKNEIHI